MENDKYIPSPPQLAVASEPLGTEYGPVGAAPKVMLITLAAAGFLVMGLAAWDHWGSDQLQRIGANQACVQVDIEKHHFKSGYPGGLGDITSEHMKMMADFSCGGMIKSIEQWDDARGARLADGSVIKTRAVKDITTFDLLSWRSSKIKEVDVPVLRPLPISM